MKNKPEPQPVPKAPVLDFIAQGIGYLILILALMAVLALITIGIEGGCEYTFDQTKQSINTLELQTSRNTEDIKAVFNDSLDAEHRIDARIADLDDRLKKLENPP